MQQLMQLSQQMQQRMTEMQEQLENETITAQAGGGIVEVTTNGKGQVQKALNATATPLEEAYIFPDW